jgi:hypothetical protein
LQLRSKSLNSLLFEAHDETSMEVGPLKMIIEWPNGTRLPVRLASDATGADLIGLIRFATTAHSPVFLLNDGHFLHPRRQLKRQRIHENSVIRVVNIGSLAFNFFEDEQGKPKDESINPVFTEILRITDLQFQQLESHRKATGYYQVILAEAVHLEPEPAERYPTILPPTASRISEEPLPFWNSSTEVDEADGGNVDENEQPGFPSDFQW